MTTRRFKTKGVDPEAAYPVELPRHLGKVLSRISIQSKFLLMLLVTSILSVAVVGYIGFESGRTSLRAAAFDRLTELRESQSRQITGELNDMKNSIILFARTSNAGTAMAAYTNGFNELDNPDAPPIEPAQEQALVDYYTNVFAAKEEAKTAVQLDVRRFFRRHTRRSTCRSTTRSRSRSRRSGSRSTTPATTAPGQPRTTGSTTSSAPSSTASSSRTPCSSIRRATSSTARTRASTSAPTSSTARSAAAT